MPVFSVALLPRVPSGVFPGASWYPPAVLSGNERRNFVFPGTAVAMMVVPSVSCHVSDHQTVVPSIHPCSE